MITDAQGKVLQKVIQTGLVEKGICQLRPEDVRKGCYPGVTAGDIETLRPLIVQGLAEQWDGSFSNDVTVTPATWKAFREWELAVMDRRFKQRRKVRRARSVPAAVLEWSPEPPEPDCRADYPREPCDAGGAPVFDC